MKWRNVNEKERGRGTAWRGEEEWKCVLRDGKREQECARKNRDGGRERRTRNIKKRRESRWAEARNNRRCE